MREDEIGERWPDIPEWADAGDLAPDVRRDLRGLSKEGAEFVALHLIAASTLADDEPELAWRHARAARAKGGRIAVVRETVGLVAYRAGEWSEAISELRAARRMGGGPGHLAVMADCERALERPEKAIELSRSAEAGQLDEDGAIEMTIVVAGARADLGQLDAALLLLEQAGIREQDADARVLYAYADLLAGADQRAEALEWFMKAYDADTDEDTDAAERIAELTDGGEQLSGDGVQVDGTGTPVHGAAEPSGPDGDPAGDDESLGSHQHPASSAGAGTGDGELPDRP